MSCADGPTYQCSGGTVLRTENGIVLTRSGVQAYGHSTSDLAEPILVKTGASGLAPASGGLAEVRIAKDTGGVVSKAVLLLDRLGLSWDGKVERPPILETFSTGAGRVTLDAGGAIAMGVLPPTSDLSFYDFAGKGANATQAHYANNVYFPRTGNPARCQADMTPCPEIESTGVHHLSGDWRSGGTTPDWSEASRLHGDGDIHAGDGPPDAHNNPTILPGGNGRGVPFPGSKGFRNIANWGLQHANLATWTTQDTVLIEEWAALSNEHNKNRRGVVAFGAVTDPALLPASGSARYSGLAYGWYAANASEEPVVFYGRATANVNFATGAVTVAVADAIRWDGSNAPLPVTLSANATMGSGDYANYLSGPVSGTLTGGVSARYFGPIVSTGSSGSGPAEFAGAFSLSNAGSGATAIGGFIGRKQ